MSVRIHHGGAPLFRGVPTSIRSKGIEYPGPYFQNPVKAVYDNIEPPSTAYCPYCILTDAETPAYLGQTSMRVNSPCAPNVDSSTQAPLWDCVAAPGWWAGGPLPATKFSRLGVPRCDYDTSLEDIIDLPIVKVILTSMDEVTFSPSFSGSAKLAAVIAMKQDEGVEPYAFRAGIVERELAAIELLTPVLDVSRKPATTPTK